MSFRRLDRYRPAKAVGAGRHPGQPEATITHPWIESDPVVADLHPHVCRRAGDSDVHLVGLRVLDDVVDRFLCNPVERVFDRQSEPWQIRTGVESYHQASPTLH